MKSFKKIYEEQIKDTKKEYIESSNFTTKPIMTKDIISPDSILCIQPAFDVTFNLDKEGMNTIIEMLENKWNSRTDKEKKNLIVILTDIYTITEDYLGGHGIPKNREDAYLGVKDTHLSLSEISGKKIGLCAERAAIGHQLLTLIEKSGLINYESSLINSHLALDKRIPHSFILLKHKSDSSKQFIFDIENPIKYKPTNESKPMPGLALYPISEEEYYSFINGEVISPKSIFEQYGMMIVGEQRYYGDGEIPTVTKKTVKLN